ncbi:hypothetical protein BJ166DRAFT_597916 [Pestalotiopsis sp. NC0098]|nr:hypothetical protein BJ166DRAFT_597916 [Pestalotiopsis sp. NC0098]
MGRHVRHFAFVLQRPTEPSRLDNVHKVFSAVPWEISQILGRLTPQTRPKFEQIYPNLFLGKTSPATILSDRFLVHILMMCVNFMTRGEDILLGLPYDKHAYIAEELPPAQNTNLSPQLHRRSWRSFRLRCDPELITTDEPTFEFLSQFLTRRTTKVELYNYPRPELPDWHDPDVADQYDISMLFDSSPGLVRVKEAKLYINNYFDTECLRLLMEYAVNVTRVTVGLPDFERNFPQFPNLDPDARFFDAMAGRAPQIESLHLYTQSYRVLPHQFDIQAEYPVLKSLRIDLPLLQGHPERWEENWQFHPPTTMSGHIPPSVQSLTLKEKWTTGQSVLLLTHNGSSLRFFDTYMDGVLSALLDDCRGKKLPALKDFTLEAYDKVESSGPFREDASMIVYEQKFRELGVVFRWIWHHDVHHAIKCPENLSERDLSRWGVNGPNHVYPYYTCDAATNFRRPDQD